MNPTKEALKFVTHDRLAARPCSLVGSGLRSSPPSRRPPSTRAWSGARTVIPPLCSPHTSSLSPCLGVTKPLISAKEFVALAKQYSNTSRRSYFTIFIYNNDAEDNDDWKDELELDYVRVHVDLR